MARATNRMHCDFAFYVGGTHENAEQLPELEKMTGVCGVKVFMGSSTGNLLVPDDDGVADILKFIRRRAAFHSEDEFRLRERRALAETGKVETHPIWRDAEAAISSTRRLVKLAREAEKIFMCCISARKRKCRYSPPIAISPPLKLPRNTSRLRRRRLMKNLAHSLR